MNNVSDDILNVDWSFSGVETDYLTHGIHRYSGKFIPQIASEAIRILTKPGDLVLDPYCGSGTTLLEAALQQRRAIGIDLNPLAVLIAGVKTTPIEKNRMRELLQTFSQLIFDLEDDSLFKQFDRDSFLADHRLTDEWYTKWFQERVLKDLIVIHRAIQSVGDLHLRNVALVAFSNILRRSSNAHQGYPNVMFDKNIGQRPRPGRIFLKALKGAIASVDTLAEYASHLGEVSVAEGNASNLSLPDGIADAVITHPPYIGSIPYAEYGMLSLKWLGKNPKEIDKLLTGGRRQSRDILDRFSADYERMLVSALRVLKHGGYLFLMVGNPTVKGTVVDLTALTIETATNVGFTGVATALRSAENRRANKMGKESIILMQKSG